jgi:hypothetical protein
MKNVYHFVFKSGNGIFLKLIGKSEGNIVEDEFIERYKIQDNIIGEVMKCNMTDEYINVNKKLPFYYIDIVIQTNKKQKTIMRVFIYYNVEKVEVNTYMEGNYIVEIDYRGRTKVIDEVKEIKNFRRFLDGVIEFTKTKEMKEMIMESIEEEDIEDIKKTVNNFIRK